MSQHTLAGEAIAAFLTTLGMAVVAAILLAGLVALLVFAFRRLGEWRRGDGRRFGIAGGFNRRQRYSDTA
jgi:Na+-transporting methylmalonyl-CoA/oxaloacetate decarboxylase gamma subunit